MDQCCIRMIRIECRNRQHLGIARNDGVALGMAAAGRRTDDTGDELDAGIVRRDRTADDIGRAALTDQIGRKVRLRKLGAVGK